MSAGPYSETADMPPVAGMTDAEAAPRTEQDASGNAAPVNAAMLEPRIIEALSTVYDPEIPVNIYELGLIYDVDIHPNGDLDIRMTLTSPACPVAGTLPLEVESKAGEVEGVGNVTVELVWDPPWTPDRMTEAAKLELGFM
ncbi:MAG: SUF system Fe-S cluster assembly protein [Alphaproteobacteria bacterium]|nr:SUF system Fe-S cluster assembly protein [Alphaproteobacteria bacterium]